MSYSGWKNKSLLEHVHVPLSENNAMCIILVNLKLNIHKVVVVAQPNSGTLRRFH
jgi:hypothetical protein